MKDETSNTSQLKIAEMGDQILQYQENESNIKIKEGMVNKNPIRQIKQMELLETNKTMQKIGNLSSK